MSPVTRRQFLQAGLLTAGGSALIGSALTSAAGKTIERAFDADPGSVGSLSDVDHIVLLMRENRSFDHYFGTLSGVRGFDDRSPAFGQRGWRRGHGPSKKGILHPFRLDTRHVYEDAEIVTDPAHDWKAQHEAWNHGAMDRWIAAHEAHDGTATPMIMGYYDRRDIPVHYALADAFTVCDGYHSSVLGPTAPNRLYWMSAALDPHGQAGGPILGELHRHRPGSLTWRTFPENLREAGVSWKVYSHPNGHSDLNGMLGHFAAYQNPASELFERGVAPTYPNDFRRDVATNTLPSVSWIVPSMAASEHPAHPAAAGAAGIVAVLDALTTNPGLWERTALIVSYDENGGFFDHVAPPTPPPGEPGEFVTHRGSSQPIGLGFRVPCLVISPYTRGGLVSSEVFDHTSQLRLLASRFGVDVPNLTTWRRRVTGDMTSLFQGRRIVDDTLPNLPPTAAAARAAITDHRLIREAARGGRSLPSAPRPMAARQETAPVRRRIG